MLGQVQRYGSFLEAFKNLRYEPGFIFIYYFLSGLDSGMLFLLLASLCVLIKYAIFKKYFMHPIIAWLLYIIIFLPNLESSQLRTAIATTVIFYVISNPVMKKNYLVEAISASIFHYIGLIILSYRLIRKPFQGLLLIILAAALFNIFITLITQYVPILILYTGFEGEANLLSSIFVAQSLIALCCILNWRLLNNTQKKGAFLIIIGAIIFIVLNEFSGIVHRIREISMLGIFPLIFSNRLRLNFPTLTLYILTAFYCLYHLFFLSRELIGHL
tara:strand:+ start:2333 stop:3151 length:819 start_codon:yes stop_codon:yes gene_type:complete